MSRSLLHAVVATSALISSSLSIEFTTFAPTRFDGTTPELGSYLQLSSLTGVISQGPAISVPPPIAPCASAFIPSEAGYIVIPANFTSLVFVHASNGTLAKSVALNPAYELPFLVYNPGDGLLYSLGMDVNNPSAFLDLVAVDPSTGAVTVVSPILTDNVLECATALDPSSGVLAFTYTGPLQMQAVGTVVLSNTSKAQAMNVLTSNGSVMSLAALPGGSSDGTPGVLYLSQDGLGSMWALSLIDAVSGNTTALVPMPRQFVNPSQGALVFDAPTQSAYALAQFVDESFGNVDVLLTFNLTGFGWSGGAPSLPNGGTGAFTSVTLNDTSIAPMGLWGLAVTSD